MIPFEYKLKRQFERIGALELQIECLENLDQTIDALFEFLQKSGREALLEELCPYFGVVWPSARALTEYLVTHAATIRGARVLELGCGLAIPSLALEKFGAEVTATDFHPEVPKFLDKNKTLNSSVGIQYLHLDWQRTSLASALSGRFDWVVGSDILYERGQPEPVARVIDEWLTPGGRAVLADPGRPYLQSFVDEMARRDFCHHTQIREVKDQTVNAEIFLLVFEREKK